MALMGILGKGIYLFCIDNKEPFQLILVCPLTSVICICWTSEWRVFFFYMPQHLLSRIWGKVREAFKSDFWKNLRFCPNQVDNGHGHGGLGHGGHGHGGHGHGGHGHGLILGLLTHNGLCICANLLNYFDLIFHGIEWSPYGEFFGSVHKIEIYCHLIF